jgi:hypothetical protein
MGSEDPMDATPGLAAGGGGGGGILKLFSNGDGSLRHGANGANGKVVIRGFLA